VPKPQPQYPGPRSGTFRQNDPFRGDRALSRFNACVGDNGGPYDLYDYAEAYFEATRLLLREAQKPGVLIDVIVYPVCLNFRHALELYIKYLITDLGNAAGIAAASRYCHEGQRTAKSVNLEFPSPQDGVDVPSAIGADVTGGDVTGAGATCAGVAGAGVGRAVSGVCAFGFRAGRCDSSGASKRTVIPSLPRNQQRLPSTLLLR
jgi:hypothetical protein